MTPLARRWLPTVLLTALLAAIFSASANAAPSLSDCGAVDVGLKKLFHFAAYAAVGLLAQLTIEGWAATSGRAGRMLGVMTSGFWSQARLAWTFSAAWAASDELHQAFTPHRTSSVVDVGIDSLGAVAGLVMLAVMRRLARRGR